MSRPSRAIAVPISRWRSAKSGRSSAVTLQHLRCAILAADRGSFRGAADALPLRLSTLCRLSGNLRTRSSRSYSRERAAALGDASRLVLSTKKKRHLVLKVPFPVQSAAKSGGVLGEQPQQLRLSPKPGSDTRPAWSRTPSNASVIAAPSNAPNGSRASWSRRSRDCGFSFRP